MTSVSLQPKGSAFVRSTIAKALADGTPAEAAVIAAARWGQQSPAAIITRAAVSGGATTAGNWGTDLVSPEGAQAEFFALVRERSVLGRLAGRRQVPANVRMLEQTGGVGAAWVPPGKSIPISAMSFAAATMQPLKIAGAVVISKELATDSSPEAERLIQADLLRAMVEAIDTALLDPANVLCPG